MLDFAKRMKRIENKEYVRKPSIRCDGTPMAIRHSHRDTLWEYPRISLVDAWQLFGPGQFAYGHDDGHWLVPHLGIWQLAASAQAMITAGWLTAPGRRLGLLEMKDENPWLDPMKHPWIFAALIVVPPLIIFGLIDWIVGGPSFPDNFEQFARFAIVFFLIWGFLNWWRARKREERQDDE